MFWLTTWLYIDNGSWPFVIAGTWKTSYDNFQGKGALSQPVNLKNLFTSSIMHLNRTTNHKKAFKAYLDLSPIMQYAIFLFSKMHYLNVNSGSELGRVNEP
jgi:hypothetical protein